MASTQTTHEPGLLAAAGGGDEQAFVRLTAPHRQALHLHCYRLLGSLHDADDALLTMPPEAARFDGRDQIGTFFATAPVDGQLDRIQLIPASANGQPALAAYAQEDTDSDFHAYGVMVFAINDDRIDWIVGFPQKPELFTRLGLPTELPR